MENTTGKNGYQKKLKVAIIGGGLVGSLAACFFGKQGHDVQLYEYREDIRKTPHVKGRTINLSMSARARAALAVVGLEDRLHKHGIPMEGRMIHPINGNQKVILYDARSKQCIYSVSRRFLNEVLLSATEKYPNVKLNFQHKLIDADLENGRLVIENKVNQEKLTVTFDLVVGADGAFSTVRKYMMKMALFNFSQTYIEHGYMELCIPPTKDGQYAMALNYLHIWPRGEFMMIALPNQDRTWTVTLFMPFEKFNYLNTPDKLIKFFEKYFPDSIPLLGKDRLVEDFFKGTPQTLVSIKCKPYHVKNKAVLIGDAAHAMVPFYGQGMNAGFEDCRLLDNLMSEYNFDLNKVLPTFSEQRSKDAHAICDLAMYNYVEMRDLVNRPSFIFRKKIDNLLYNFFPKTWVPLYNSVTFSDMGYNDCVTNRKWQDDLLKKASFFFVGASACALALGVHILQNVE